MTKKQSNQMDMLFAKLVELSDKVDQLSDQLNSHIAGNNRSEPIIADLSDFDAVEGIDIPLMKQAVSLNV